MNNCFSELSDNFDIRIDDEYNVYLIDNKLTNCKLTTIRYHISEVCHGKRKTAAKFIWKLSE